MVSRIVIPPKPKSPDEIRLCVDMRVASKAILRTRHVTPTISDLRAELDGASIFSKIDLRSGYTNWYYIQTVDILPCSYMELFKRLIVGVNSAAEVFQHTIQTVLESIRGAKSISDDIIVYSRDKEEYDRTLTETIEVRHSVLTINYKKCEFKVRKIKLYGHTFTKVGISPNPEKFQSLQRVYKPQTNPKSAHSLELSNAAPTSSTTSPP